MQQVKVWNNKMELSLSELLRQIIEEENYVDIVIPTITVNGLGTLQAIIIYHPINDNYAQVER